MKIRRADLEGVLLIEPEIYRDDRGYFLETWREAYFQDSDISPPISGRFVQENFSWSRQGVIRGLHYQTGSAAQQKLVRVTHGRILDVVVDIRKESSTFGQHLTVELDDKEHLMILVPAGFAHGFSVLSAEAGISYLCSAYYNPSMERGIRWSDPELDIDWKVSDPLVSEKDQNQPLLAELADGDLL